MIDAGCIAELDRQQALFAPSAARRDRLARLRRGAPAVVTGQQVGLFLGPAYGIYKAATAVVEARARDAVPIFWLQAEDHDAEEVSTCRVTDGAGEGQTIRLVPSGSARASLAHRKLGAAVRPALDELARALGETPHRDACLDHLRAAYRPERGWVEAFAQVMAELFAPEGLLVFHPRTPQVAALSRPVHRWAIERAEAIDAILERPGPKAVPPRPGCLLSFFHPSGPEGDRYRPTRENGGYRWPGTSRTMTREALLAALDDDPMAFSTSALLRPLLQDHLFPTVAYVGGPTELVYLEQIRPLYQDFGRAMPELVARARFVVTDPPCRRKLEALGRTAPELETPEALAGLGKQTSSRAAEALRSELSGLSARLEGLRPELTGLGLEQGLEKTIAHVARGMLRLAERIEAAERRSDETLTARLAYLGRWLRPDGQPQERHLGFPHFAARFGPRAFVEAVLGAVGEDRGLQELPLWP